MPDDLDKLRAAILRMQGWDYVDMKGGNNPCWYHKDGRCRYDPLADDRLHELGKLAESIGEWSVGQVIGEGGYFGSIMCGDRYIEELGDTACVALARAIVNAKGGADGR